MVPGKISKFVEFRRIWRHGLGSAGAPEGNFQRCFLQLSFLQRHCASSLAAVKASFWNPAISGKVWRSAKFGCNQAYGVCTAGAPKRVEQRFCCTKSAKSAPSLQSLHLAHFVHFVISLWKQMHTLCRLCNHLVKTLSMHTGCRLTAHLDFRTMYRLIAHFVVVFILYRISSVHKVCKVCKCRYCGHLTKKAQKYAISMHLHTMCRLCAHV